MMESKPLTWKFGYVLEIYCPEEHGEHLNTRCLRYFDLEDLKKTAVGFAKHHNFHVKIYGYDPESNEHDNLVFEFDPKLSNPNT